MPGQDEAQHRTILYNLYIFKRKPPEVCTELGG